MPSFRDTRHVWLLAGLILLAGFCFFTLRAELVPASFGQQGPYRADALREIAARPSRFHADAVCHQCHQEVEHERAESRHRAVRCVHCHGQATEHVVQSRAAAENPALKLPPLQPWDGQIPSHVDLFTSQDRKLCLACHEAALGMPADFKKIDVAAHLEEQGASEPTSAETCLECHGGHNTAP